MHTLPLFQVKLEKTAESMKMFSCQGAQNISQTIQS